MLIHPFTPPVSNTLSQAPPPPFLLLPCYQHTVEPPAGSGCATSPFSLKTMGWKPGKRLCPLRLSCVWISEGDSGEKRASCSTLCIQKHTHTSFRETPTCSATVETHSIQRSDRSLTKDPVAIKALFSLKEKHTKQCFVYVKQCLSLVACFLPVFCCSESSTQTHFKGTQLRKAQERERRTRTFSVLLLSIATASTRFFLLCSMK